LHFRSDGSTAIYGDYISAKVSAEQKRLTAMSRWLLKVPRICNNMKRSFRFSLFDHGEAGSSRYLTMSRSGLSLSPVSLDSAISRSGMQKCKSKHISHNIFEIHAKLTAREAPRANRLCANWNNRIDNVNIWKCTFMQTRDAMMIREMFARLDREFGRKLCTNEYAPPNE